MNYTDQKNQTHGTNKYKTMYVKIFKRQNNNVREEIRQKQWLKLG